MRAGRLLLIVGLIIVLVAVAIGAYMFLLGGGGGEVAPEPVEQETTPVPEQEVVVAAQDIPRGMMIQPDSGAVVTTTWPENAVSELAVTSADAVYGRITRQDIARGTPIMEGMLSDVPGELGDVGSDAALRIPSGKVAYALPISRYSSVAWALKPGDHVDVMISLLTVELDEAFQTALPNRFSCASPAEECEGGVLGRLEALPNGWVVNVFPDEEQRPSLVTQLTVQDVTVLRIGDWDEPEEEPAQTPTPAAEGEGEREAAVPTPEPPDLVRPLTLVLDPQDAAVLKYAEESGASIDLILRSAADAGVEVSTEAVTLQYLFEQFNIEVPSKLPYGVEPPLESLRPGAAGQSQPLGVEGGRVPAIRGSGTPPEAVETEE